MYDNTNKFKELYVEFEKIIEKEYKEKYGEKNVRVADVIDEKRAKRISPYYENYEFLDFCRRYRNKISHEENELKYLDFTDSAIERLEEIIYRIKNPYDVYSKSVKDVFSRTLSDKVGETMEIMLDKNYSYVPIYNENRELVGIFSDNIIFEFLAKKSKIEITDSTSFSDIYDLIKLENSKDHVKFFPKKKLYDEVVNHFVNLYKKGDRLRCIMVTENGKEGEVVEGIITTWDIIKEERIFKN